MNYSVEILPQALDNIESAYRWMADNYSPERAEQWYEELMTAVRSLEQFPNRASQAPEAAEIKLDIRQLFVYLWERRGNIECYLWLTKDMFLFCMSVMLVNLG
jgi:plasmid stabilization system protein ParE